MKQKLLPFFVECCANVEMIVLHSTAFEIDEALRLYEAREVSCHYFIGSGGDVWRLVEESKRAWHAGKGQWRAITGDINSCSIGIELANSTLGQTDFGSVQKEALKKLLKDILHRYRIKPENIVGHSDMAPSRKADPGKAFFWKELAAEGIGLWPDLNDAVGWEENDPAELLGIIGYDTRDLGAAALAFCRRFLPEKVPEVSDVWALDANPGRADDALFEDEKFWRVLRAAAHKYRSESSTPCRI